MHRPISTIIPSRLDRLRRFYSGGNGLLAVVAFILFAISFIDFPLAWLASLAAFGIFLLMLGNTAIGIHDKVAQEAALEQRHIESLRAQINDLQALHVQVNDLQVLSAQVAYLQTLRPQVDELYQLEGVSSFYHINRVLQPGDISKIQSDWSHALGLPNLKKAELLFYAHRIRMIERLSIGRMAAPIETVLLRSLVILSVSAKPTRVLEIGTLFGIGASAVYEVCRTQGKLLELHLVDPLFGYYQDKSMDVVLNIDVNKETLQLNLTRANVPQEQVTLYEGLSTDDHIIERVRQHQFDVLVIDGDHTRNGVKQDFETYLSVVKDDGYIIFDDYNNPDWPDISAYVDEEIRPRNDLLFVGADWNTAVFRKVR